MLLGHKATGEVERHAGINLHSKNFLTYYAFLTETLKHKIRM